MCQRKSWWGVSYGILLQNYEGLWELCWEVFRGHFLWFSEISLREKAAAGDFCEALGIFWSYLRAEYVRMRVTWNVYYLAVVDVVLKNVAEPAQWI